MKEIDLDKHPEAVEVKRPKIIIFHYNWSVFYALANPPLSHASNTEQGTVPNTAGFRSRPVLGRLREFSIRSRLQLLVKEKIMLEFFKAVYELS